MQLVNYLMPIPVASRSKSWVCGPSLTGVADSNPALGRGYLCCGCYVLSCIGICDGPISRPEES